MTYDEYNARTEAIRERGNETMGETLTLINGNRQKYVVGLPRLVILGPRYNDVAMGHICEETGLAFQGDYNPEAQPTSSAQIVKLLLTYNFKTQYHDNATTKNTIFLKSDHHTGFNVDSICYDCVKENNIHVGDLKPGDRLAC